LTARRARRRVARIPPAGGRRAKGKGKKKDGAAVADPMTAVLATFRDPARTGWEDAWAGLEPTFQTAKSIRKWEKLAALGEAGEDAYFEDDYMLGTQREVAKAIAKKYRARRADGERWCMFDECELEEGLDQWEVKRQNLHFRWGDRDLGDFECKLSLDPETFEWSVKPVPVAWFHDERFVRFLEELVWKVPLKHGLSASIAHGGGQFSLSAKTFLVGSVLADDIATRLNHPELSTWVMDWPNCDDRAFRATRRRYEAFKRCLDAYWAGGYHPESTGGLTPEHCYLDRGFGPFPAKRAGLMDPRRGPVGDAVAVFQTNFAFGRSVRLEAQAIHPGYWQSQSEDAEGYRPDQIMRYSEANLNRLQIAGERHVKSGKVLDAERVPELHAPLEPGHLYDEASWEDRAQMSRTSARDLVEALLLDVHAARWLAAHPGVKVKEALAQDALLLDGEQTVARHGGKDALAALRREARAANLEASDGRIKADWIEPETLFWAAWRVLPDKERARVAHEAVLGFVERVEEAATVDPRDEARKDPMEWHRHRVHPFLWQALAGAKLKASDPVARELRAFEARKDEYLARRPIFSQTGRPAPWEG
jgi:hypothetical protein